eukprot:2344434-Amphidinium_carterae.1
MAEEGGSGIARDSVDYTWHSIVLRVANYDARLDHVTSQCRWAECIIYTTIVKDLKNVYLT